MSEHEIYHQRAESASLTFTGGELKVRETDSFSGHGIRVLHEEKIGFAYCQDEKEIPNTIAQAKKLSRFAVESRFSFAPKAAYKKLDVANPKFVPSNYRSLYAYLDEAREIAESKGGKSKVIIEMDSLSTKIENTTGFSGGYEQKEISFYVECMHGDGSGISYFVSNNEFPDSHELGLKAAEMAKSMQDSKKPETGVHTIVMQLEALGSLVETLLPSFSGDWKRRGISRAVAGKKMFSDKLTISDDPLAKGSSARPFDDEGIPSQKKYLIKNGIVKSFLYDRETAALENVDESGSCSRSAYDSAPTIGASNIAISPGDWTSLDELDKYIEVHNVHGAHTANPTTGDIGLEVSTAFLVNKGKRTPVKGFMITGNVFDMFSNIELEKEIRVLDDLISPRIAFKDVKVVS